MARQVASITCRAEADEGFLCCEDSILAKEGPVFFGGKSFRNTYCRLSTESWGASRMMYLTK